jgi:hypothetical protein
MQDRTLLIIALCTIACGMTVLLGIALFYDMPILSIANASTMGEGKAVRVKGEVLQTRQRGNITTITIMEPATIDIVIFQSVQLQKGACIIAQGKISSFKNREQLTATRLTSC